jgi:hypothetical protein
MHGYGDVISIGTFIGRWKHWGPFFLIATRVLTLAGKTTLQSGKIRENLKVAKLDFLCTGPYVKIEPFLCLDDGIRYIQL